ncbi:uncharacterized protein LOC110849054 [Folsomia candida]|uniref:Ciliary microtubule inner protein 2A-C-like domain-containing protein n=1 Tax=Folsomia candida TaxID=158441 RepID=A0A226EFI6_FOLCA|nr:uncharacterized protein LOC110849054 [Folsomia candida]OXA55814.1 hypothetical protein Fcan01_09381 [Folsomia candida]
MAVSCTNGTPSPHHIPGYDGFVPGHLATIGRTYAKGTHDVLRTLGLAGVKDKPCTKSCRSGDPCADHWRDLRARMHMVQGEIDPNPCQGTDWNIRNKFCVQKPQNLCEPKLKKMNQHGYLSRLSVYQKKNGDAFGVTSCKADNTFPCKAAAPSNRPFWREYEDLTNYDPFKEYEPECRHVRLPKLKYKAETCWDEDFYLPVDAYEDYCREKYVCPPKKCECLPLDARKPDNEVKFYRHEQDPELFVAPYFADPTNKYRYFKTGFTGHVPTYKYRFGEPYEQSTRKALNKWTSRYMTDHLKAKCPVWIDPEQYCDKNDYFKMSCKPRKTYDGHFHEKRIRDRLKPIFNPKDCIPPYTNDPIALCIQSNNPTSKDIC